MSDVERCSVSFERDGEVITRSVRGPSAVLGRSAECDVIVPQRGISRTHARLDLEDGVWTLTDLESVNGTFINGVRISAGKLRDGDRILLGHVGLDVAIGERRTEAAASPSGDVSGRATLVYETVAEERELSVLYGYLDKFPTIAATMPAASVARLLNSIFERLADVADESGGSIGAVMGDGLMVFFGASTTGEGHAERATRAALRMREVVKAIGEELETEPPLSMRFGINSGSAIVGDVGPEVLRQYTVVGDTAAVAGRLAYTSAMTGEILVSGSTRQAVGKRFVLRELPSQKIRGRSERVELFAVEGRR